MKRSKTFLTKAAMLLIVALFSLTGARAQQTLPYESGFEEENQRVGWELYRDNNQTGLSTNAARTGTYGFRFYYPEQSAYLLSPIFTGGDWGVSVSFWYKNYNASYSEQFQVGYTTDETVTDPSTFTYGDVVTASTHQWQQYSNVFPAGTKRIAVKYIYTDGHYLFLDDFSFAGPVVIHGIENFTDSTHVEITCDIEGATILYSTDKGTSWKTYEAGFDLYETTTVIAKATKNGTESPEFSKLFLKSSDIKVFTWDLSKAPTGTTSSTSVTWTNDAQGNPTNAKMTLAKGSSSTNADNYLGGSQQQYGYGGGTYTANHTRMYSDQTLTFEPIGDYEITSIEMTATNSNQGNTLNNNMTTLSNATKTRSGNKVTITPQDGSAPVVATFSGQVQVSGVTVHYYPTSSPFIAIKALDETVNETSASVTDAKLATLYNRVDKSNATAVLCDAQGNPANYDWITVSLTNDENKNLQYSLTANTTFAERTAYVKVTADDISSPVVAIIQAKPYTVKVGKVGYTTYVAPAADAVSFPEGLTAYIVFEHNGNYVRLSERASVPAGTPVVLKSEEAMQSENGIEYALIITTSPENVDDNLLKASEADFAPTESHTIYCLANKSRGIGFYPVKIGVTVPAGKAYLETTGEAKEFYGFEVDDATGINDLDVDANVDGNDVIYNLAGQRLQKMQKGINIVNGKKILF